MKGILYVNEAESAMRVMHSLEELAVLRVYDETPTHFMQLFDRVPTELYG